MRFVDEPKVCVQAGGACGVWPYRYAQLFEQVYTFEPVEENFNCLFENTMDLMNVDTFAYALSDKKQYGNMVLDKSEEGNSGAYFYQPGYGIACTMTLDSIALSRCDLLQLDVEGHELEALNGAAETIKRCRPTIVLEEKPLPQMNRDHRAARRYIEAIGYREFGAIHRDVVFQC